MKQDQSEASVNKIEGVGSPDISKDFESFIDSENSFKDPVDVTATQPIVSDEKNLANS